MQNVMIRGQIFCYKPSENYPDTLEVYDGQGVDFIGLAECYSMDYSDIYSAIQDMLLSDRDAALDVA